ncbi:MAG TPA: DUF1697 domain-containing protein [Candidatus Saccharimonadia bacterium]|nr:DUF1697 domain-containing protein [Candidatus Saccharimonadia bacterium]
MTRYVALLRGINVGGHTVKMEVLRNIFTELGFNDVRSYINSGNIFFDTDNSDKQRLTRTIEKRLHEHLGYAVPTFLRSIAELEAITTQEPFKDIELTSDKRFCVIFTNEPIGSTAPLPQHSSKGDADLVAANPYEAFIVWHIINGRPPSGKFAEGMLPPVTTTRFYHTLIKILAAAKAY